MDTTPEYIKMCEKAEEIQNQKYKHTSPKDYIAFGDCPLRIWLPRQDQLQEMVKLSDRKLMKEFKYFLIWITGQAIGDHNRNDSPNPLKYTMPYGIFLPSFEQLWLAFVMKEKYNKIWENDKWNLIRKIG